jgi:hypothetical protein
LNGAGAPEEHPPCRGPGFHTPAEFLNTISAAIITVNNEVSCAVLLLDWIQVVCTYHPGTATVTAAVGVPAVLAGLPQPPNICISNLVPLLNEPYLQATVWALISSDLPALILNTMGIGHHLVNMTNELAQGHTKQATAQAFLL